MSSNHLQNYQKKKKKKNSDWKMHVLFSKMKVAEFHAKEQSKFKIVENFTQNILLKSEVLLTLFLKKCYFVW